MSVVNVLKVCYQAESAFLQLNELSSAKLDHCWSSNGVIESVYCRLVLEFLVGVVFKRENNHIIETYNISNFAAAPIALCFRHVARFLCAL